MGATFSKRLIQACLVALAACSNGAAPVEREAADSAKQGLVEAAPAEAKTTTTTSPVTVNAATRAPQRTDVEPALPTPLALSTEIPQNAPAVLQGENKVNPADSLQPVLPGGRVNYKALAAKYGAPNTKLKLNPRAIDVSKMPGFSTVEIEADQLTFPAATSEWLLGKTKGDVLTCALDCPPLGFLRRVKSVQKSGEFIIVKTTQGNLADLVTDGWLHVHTPTRLAPLPTMAVNSDDRLLHHPKYWWMTYGIEGSSYLWPLDWTDPGLGVSGQSFQAATALAYDFEFDLTEDNGFVETLSFVNNTTAHLAISTATTTTLVTTTTVSTNYDDHPSVCKGWNFIGICFKGYTDAYTNITVTTTINKVWSTILTPTPLPPGPTTPPYPPQAPTSTTTTVTVQSSQVNYDIGSRTDTNVTVTATETTAAPDLTTAQRPTSGTNGAPPLAVQFAPAPYTNTMALTPEVLDLGGFYVVYSPQLIQTMTATVEYNNAVDVQATIFFNDQASTGFTYNYSTGFNAVGSGIQTYGPPLNQAIATATGSQAGQAGTNFSGTMNYGIQMNVGLYDQVGPNINHNIKGTIDVNFSNSSISESSDNGFDDTHTCGPNQNQSCNPASSGSLGFSDSCNTIHEEVSITSGISGTVNMGNLSQIMDLTIAPRSYNIPIPNQHCPSCSVSAQCGQAGPGYSCEDSNHNLCTGSTSGCWCQPDGTTCLQGTCNQNSDCGPVYDGHSSVQCINVPLEGPPNGPGGSQNCCNGLNEYGSACAIRACTYNPNNLAAGNNQCPSGDVCTETNCCLAASCPNGAAATGCPSGYQKDVDSTGTLQSPCCVPAGCSEGSCGNCANGSTACNYASPEFCCQGSSCTYAVCSKASDCVPPGASSSGVSCNGGCCIPDNKCDTAALCVNTAPGAAQNSVCPGGGAEYYCNADPKKNNPSQSPFCCECNSGSTCRNGNSCASGDYCDATGCCYPCGNSGAQTPSNGSACHTSGNGASGVWNGSGNLCPTVTPPDGGTAHYCK